MAMGKNYPKTLRTLIREVYADLKKSGAKEVTIRELNDEINNKHPSLVALEKERLFREAINTSIRQMLKSDSNSLRSSQLSLPLGLTDIVLPVCLPIKYSAREYAWVEPYDMTFAQLEKKISQKTIALKASIELQSLERVRDYLKPYMTSKPGFSPTTQRRGRRGSNRRGSAERADDFAVNGLRERLQRFVRTKPRLPSCRT
jgi:hypothetical protein